MPLQNFVARRLPTISAAWLNAVDVLKFTVFNDATTKPAARTALELQAQLVAQGTDAGPVNAAVVTLTSVGTGWLRDTGVKVTFVPNLVNTGPATLNVNGTGAAAVINQAGDPLTGGEFSEPVIVRWTGTSWRIIAGSIDIQYARTAAEIAAAIIPLDYKWLPGYVRRYGADPTGVASSSVAVQAAITVGQTVYFTDGTYSISNVTSTVNNQNFVGLGNVTITKRANGAIWNVNGRDSYFFNIKFDGTGFTGDNIIINHDNCTLLTCGSRFAAGRAVRVTSAIGTASGTRIISTNDIYHTSDATVNGYDLEFAGNTGNYNRVVAVNTGQATGGILVDNTSISISDCQFGKFRTQNNAGSFVCNCRINGVTEIRSSSNVLTNNTYSASVTIGNGATGYSNIVFSDSNVIQGGSTFTLSSGVIDSVIHVEQMQDTGVTVVLNDTGDNFVTSRAINYTPTWTASVANPVLNDGVFQYATYTRKGRRMVLDVSLLMGAATTFGAGTWRLSLPAGFTVFGARGSIGTAWALDATAVPWVMVAEALGGLAYITFYSDQVGGQVGAANPFAWAVSDRLRFSIEFDVG